ncbi:MAG: hypothetical protein ABWX92_14875 [Mycetocola sp.]
MGMFDSLYDERNNEWQTKAFGCNLSVFRIGDTITADAAGTFQFEILGPCATSASTAEFSYATVREGVLSSIDTEREASFPLLNYSGWVIDHGTRKAV